MNSESLPRGGYVETSPSGFARAATLPADGFNLSDLLVSLLYALMLAGYPLISTLPQLLDVETRSVSIPYRVVYLLLSLFVFIYWGLVRGRYFTGRIWAVILPFWGLLLFRMIYDLTTDPSAVAPLSPAALTGSASEAYQWTGGVVLIPMLAFGVIPSKKMLLVAERIMFSMLCASGLMLAYFGWGNALTQSTGRLSAGTLSPISVGYVGSSLIILSIVTALQIQYSRARILFVPSGLLGSFLLLASEARGPQLATALFCVLYVVSRRKSWKLWGGLVLAGSLLIPAAIISSDFIQSNSTIKVLSRWSDSDRAGNSSVSNRRIIMESAWDEFLQAPVFGSTWVEPRTLSYPHNIALEALMASGVVGGALLCLMLSITASRAVLIIRNYPALNWIVALYIQALVNSMLSGSLYIDPGFWCWSLAVMIGYEIYSSRTSGTLG